MNASPVNRRDSSSSIPSTFWINAPRFCTIVTVGRRGGVDGVGGRGGIGGGGAAFRVILSPRLAITDLDRVILD